MSPACIGFHQLPANSHVPNLPQSKNFILTGLQQTNRNRRTMIKFLNNELKGNQVVNKLTRLSDLKNVFESEQARAVLRQDTIVYETASYFPVKEGCTGGLFFGITTIYPGQVGNEYFMTRGHFHALPDRGEYYWCISGKGSLLLMNRERETRMEEMTVGSLHYIPGHTAHRVANTGKEPLCFGACWPADAGYDYESIAKHGFFARLVNKDEMPLLVRVK